MIGTARRGTWRLPWETASPGLWPPSTCRLGSCEWTDHRSVTVSAMRPVRHSLAMPSSPSTAML